MVRWRELLWRNRKRVLRARQRFLREETAEEPLWGILAREVVEWDMGVGGGTY